MRTFNITAPDRAILSKISHHIDNLTKPKGSLGMLEDLALQISLVQQTLTPELRNPHNILFAADHGILDEGVSVSPREVTWQQLAHFSRGGAESISYASRMDSNLCSSTPELTLIYLKGMA